MIKLKRSQCSILPLVLKGKWYDMIATGEKKEEYRADSEYWRIRFYNWDMAFNGRNTPVVEFRRGYSKDAPRMAFWTFGIETVSGLRPYARKVGARHPEWGEPKEPHLFVKLGGRVQLIDDKKGGAK